MYIFIYLFIYETKIYIGGKLQFFYNIFLLLLYALLLPEFDRVHPVV
jgi:hypothetical protein